MKYLIVWYLATGFWHWLFAVALFDWERPEDAPRRGLMLVGMLLFWPLVWLAIAFGFIYDTAVGFWKLYQFTLRKSRKKRDGRKK